MLHEPGDEQRRDPSVLHCRSGDKTGNTVRVQVDVGQPGAGLLPAADVWVFVRGRKCLFTFLIDPGEL